MSLILSTNEKNYFNFESAATGFLTSGEYNSRLIAAFKPATFPKRSGYLVVKGQGWASVQNCRLTLNLHGWQPDFSMAREMWIGTLDMPEGGNFSFESVLKVRPNYSFGDDSGDSLSTLICTPYPSLVSTIQQPVIFGGVRSDADTSYFMTIGWRVLGDDPSPIPQRSITLLNFVVEYKEQ